MVEKIVYTGLCSGGPMDGQVGQSRFPKGFLLVDKPNNRVWIYDYKEQIPLASVFRVREPGGRELELDGRLRAATEPDYDVRALDAP